MNTKLALGAVLVGLALWIKGKAHADAPAKKPDPVRATKGAVGGRAFLKGLDEVGIVGSVSYHADGSVTEYENNFWAGTKSTRTYSAAEWAARDAALGGA